MKIIKQAHLRDVLNALEKEEITFSRAAEILNGIAREAVHQALDEAAEKAEVREIYQGEVIDTFHSQFIDGNDYEVHKESILKLKEKY